MMKQSHTQKADSTDSWFIAVMDRLWLALSAASLMLTLLFSGVAAAGDVSAASEVSKSVGRVTLVIGKAYIERSGQKLPIKVGSHIEPKDQLTTLQSGHVHLRFDDQALLSLRPNSHLVIDRYDYDSANPSASSVKFTLSEGVVRSVSGEAAKSARERFRLNTPIAAVGVRGTDFVVSSDKQQIRALVNEGTIVVAPFSSACAASAFGPCVENAVVLSKGDDRILEMNQFESAPRLLPLRGTEIPGLTDGETEETDDLQEDAPGASRYGDDKYNETQLGHAVLKPVVAKPPVVAPVPLPDFTPSVPVGKGPLTQGQLVWGRWSEGLAATDRITLSYAEASAGRKVTVGNNSYALFRTETGTDRVKQGLGKVNFNLKSAQANYVTPGGAQAMAVNGGTLGINFDAQTFQTGLSLNSQATGAVQFSASGRIDETGYFNAISPGSRLGGAVSLDGTEAGYFFSQQLNEGSVEGLTLWGAK